MASPHWRAIVYHQPLTFEEALRLKADHADHLSVLCGGTDLLVAMNRGQWNPPGILDLSRVDGNTDITREGNVYRIAGGATWTRAAQLPIAALAQAALSIGGVQIRNRGTIAGNLGTASPAGDGCVALLALDAVLEIAHADRGTRDVPIGEFFLDYRRTALAPDELIRCVRIPADWTTAWYKIGKRGSVNISLVCCAIGRAPEGQFRVAFGCVGPYPMRAKRTEELLSAGILTEETVEQACRIVLTEVRPIDDHRASAAYRRAMCAVLLRRLLMENFLEVTAYG